LFFFKFIIIDIARKNIRAIKASTNCEIVAIASRSIDKANKYCIDNEINDVIKYGNYDELLLSDTIDAVYIPLPTSLHLEYAIKACNNKKHILLEKPCALNSIELSQIIDAANLNNVLFMDGVMFMHHNRLENMMRSFHQNHLIVNRVNSSFAFNGNNEFLKTNIRNNSSCDPLGALGDLGWYCIRLGIYYIFMQLYIIIIIFFITIIIII
jgi:predicted dehydrogenase